jgi:hypothetical protein
MKKNKKLRKLSTKKMQGIQKKLTDSFTTHRLDWLEKLALVVGLWFLIIPIPYKLLLVVLLIIPIAGLILNGLHGRPSFASLFRITGKDDQEKLDLADFIDYPPWVLLLRILFDFEFDAYKSMVIPGIVAVALVIAFLFVTHRGIGNGVKYRKDMYLLAIANIIVYAIAGAYAVNCVFDNRPAEKYNTAVTSKHVSKGRRSTTYWVKVQPWGHHRDTEKIYVDASQYYSIEKGDSVTIDMHKGLLGIPWYHIAKPKARNDLD